MRSICAELCFIKLRHSFLIKVRLIWKNGVSIRLFCWLTIDLFDLWRCLFLSLNNFKQLNNSNGGQICGCYCRPTTSHQLVARVGLNVWPTLTPIPTKPWEPWPVAHLEFMTSIEDIINALICTFPSSNRCRCRCIIIRRSSDQMQSNT